ncbi:hypothetical protein C0993_004827 [Termitomyces sp. T159_Od127]|nr:hypothetical protein C0993_004827 [Termitomyces sp. T159_Od127]
MDPLNAASDYVKNHFWKGLNMAAMEALVNTDYETMEQVRNILLCRESKLTDLAAQHKGTWQVASAAGPCAPAPTSGPAAMNMMVRAAPPPPSADPNAMDVDHAKANPVLRKCFKCKQAGHLMAACPQWAAAIKVAVQEALTAMEVKVEKEPKMGFA